MLRSRWAISALPIQTVGHHTTYLESTAESIEQDSEEEQGASAEKALGVRLEIVENAANDQS